MPPVGRTLEYRLFSLAVETLWQLSTAKNIFCQTTLISPSLAPYMWNFYYKQLVHGGWMVPQPAAWRLETQEKWWYNPRLSPKAWEPMELWCKSQPKDRKRLMSQLSQPGRKEWILPFSAFCSVHTFSRLKVASPHWRGWSTLWSPLIQMIILPGNNFTDTARNNI